MSCVSKQSNKWPRTFNIDLIQSLPTVRHQYDALQSRNCYSRLHKKGWNSQTRIERTNTGSFPQAISFSLAKLKRERILVNFDMKLLLIVIVNRKKINGGSFSIAPRFRFCRLCRWRLHFGLNPLKNESFFQSSHELRSE